MTAPGDGHRRKQRWEGTRKEGRRWCFAIASCVVEIFQQCASPLLSNVHLILQILKDGNKQEKWLLVLTMDPTVDGVCC